MGSAALLCVASSLPAVAGTIALDNDSIRTAVDAWLSTPTAAKPMYGHISTWETRRVTDMSYLFAWKSYFNEDISAWDTSGVTTMESMFLDASAFNGDIAGWAVESVTTMNRMFRGASSFNQDIGAWDTSGVTTMYAMFMYASAFDQDIGAWNIDSATSMYQMFASALAFDQDLGWCVDDDVNLDYAFLFTPCESTSCGVHQGICDYPMTDSNIRMPRTVNGTGHTGPSEFCATSI